jgi:hypothetical protein
MNGGRAGRERRGRDESRPYGNLQGRSLVARVRAETGDLDHVVHSRLEPLGQTMTSTAIDEEFHLAS